MTFHLTTLPELETDRLRLRGIVPDDAEVWLAIFSHPSVIRFLIDFNRSQTNLHEIHEIITWTEDIFANKSGMRWALTLKPDTTMIGSCGFHLYSAANRCAEIGYELHHDHWRKGIMSEALHKVLQFGFDELDLHRIEANVAVGNVASAGLLRHLGFELEGTWRNKLFSRGRFHDLWQFGLLKDEFHPK